MMVDLPYVIKTSLLIQSVVSNGQVGSGTNTACVPAGHRMELCNFHSLVLQHVDGWNWKVSSMQDYLKQKPKS